ncbi:hypothetical protein MRB53_040834 [Persea americana]|nr:hypothetical protein MRB53_040834 [Persea americana]
MLLVCHFLANVLAIILIKHDSVVPFVENYGNDNLLKVFQPELKVYEGCVPFAVVDKYGRINNGLRLTGEDDGKCSLSTGQTYVRSGTYNGNTGILYCWYFPKMQLNSYGYTRGHRHGFLCAVFWFRDATSVWPYIMQYTSFNRWKNDTQWAMRDGRPVLMKNVRAIMDRCQCIGRNATFDRVASHVVLGETVFELVPIRTTSTSKMSF